MRSGIWKRRLEARLVRPIARSLLRFSYRSSRDFPFGTSPRASRERYMELWENERRRSYTEVDTYEDTSGFRIDREWLEDLALHTQVVIKSSPLCWQHGRVLYSALRSLLGRLGVDDLSNGIRILETGTARGFSALCLARALSDGDASGTLVTFDLLPHGTPMFWNCIDDQEGPKTRRELLNQWKNLVQRYLVFVEGDTRDMLPRVDLERVHFAFLDGAHTYEDVLFEFNQIRHRQHVGDVLVFDDYVDRLFPGVVRAVDEICDHHGYVREVIRASETRAYLVATLER